MYTLKFCVYENYSKTSVPCIFYKLNNATYENRNWIHSTYQNTKMTPEFSNLNKQ